MTVPSSKNRKDHIISSGTAGYDYDFRIFSNSNLVVKSRSIAGIETTLVLDTDYTVSGAGNQNGGTITLSLAYRTAHDGESLAILRILPVVQNTSIRNQGKFYPETHEDVFDYQTMVSQQISESIGRTMRLPESVSSDLANPELPAPAPLSVLGWDTVGEKIVNYDAESLAGSIAVVDWLSNVFSGDNVTTTFALSRAPGVAENCDASISGVTQMPSIDYSVSGASIIFASAPPAGTNNICVRYGSVVPASASTPLDNSVTSAKIVDGSVTQAKLAPAYETTLAKNNAAQNFTAPQRSALLTDNDLSFDLSAKQNFKATPTAGGALTFTNQADGLSGFVILVNGSNYAITAHANTKISATALARISATGTYRIDYASDGTNTYCTASESLT